MLQSAVRNRTYRGYESPIQALRTSYLGHRAHIIQLRCAFSIDYRQLCPDVSTSSALLQF